MKQAQFLAENPSSNDEYVYYCKPVAGGLEVIAVVRNRKLTADEMKTLKGAMKSGGHVFTRMVKYSGYEKPDFTKTINGTISSNSEPYFVVVDSNNDKVIHKLRTRSAAEKIADAKNVKGGNDRYYVMGFNERAENPNSNAFNIVRERIANAQSGYQDWEVEALEKEGLLKWTAKRQPVPHRGLIGTRHEGNVWTFIITYIIGGKKYETPMTIMQTRRDDYFTQKVREHLAIDIKYRK